MKREYMVKVNYLTSMFVDRFELSNSKTSLFCYIGDKICSIIPLNCFKLEYKWTLDEGTMVFDLVEVNNK